MTVSAAAQMTPDSPSPPIPGPAGTDLAGNAAAGSFDIVVRAPPDVRALLETHLELQRYRAVTDLDDSEIARLIVVAEANVRNLVGTLGYFNPTIAITRETTPLAGGGFRSVIVVAVQPEAITRIGAINITFDGDIATSQAAGVLEQRRAIERSWRLPTGQPFTQDAWDSAKTQALRDLVARRYPAGRLEDSLADIDAPNQSATLSLKLDSGPAYFLGALQVTGVDRYNPVLVPRLTRLPQGAVYDQKALLEAQQRIASSGYFDSANVFINPDDDPNAMPVSVQVREAKLQKIILGVGITTDAGPRLSLEHSHNRVPSTDWRAVTKLQLEKKAPFAQTEWTSLPDDASWRWVALARAERINDNTLVTQGQRLRFGRTQTSDRIDRNIYVQYERAKVTGSGVQGSTASDAGDGSSLSANYVWTGRYFDNLPFPGRGYGLGFELGGGITLSTAAGNKRQPYTRGVARWLGIQPVASGRLAFRAEAGAVVARDVARIPSAELFRTGGDGTVRGYGYRDIGITLPNGAIGPGRYVAIGSVEWQRRLFSKGLPTEFEHTLFVDVGAVADKPQNFRPAVGIGTGVRWRSPIGPLQIDLAYGVKAQSLRLHTTVGFVF